MYNYSLIYLNPKGEVKFKPFVPAVVLDGDGNPNHYLCNVIPDEPYFVLGVHIDTYGPIVNISTIVSKDALTPLNLFHLSVVNQRHSSYPVGCFNLHPLDYNNASQSFDFTCAIYG